METVCGSLPMLPPSGSYQVLLLQTSFERAWRDIGANSSGSSLYEELVASYSEPHRRYHSIQHLTECLQTYDMVRLLAERPAEVELALWFHDAIYDVRRGDNEERSADWAKRELAFAAVPEEAVARVHALVMVTRHTETPTCADQQLLVDVDLSILGAPQDRFAEYEQQIRDEYSFVPNWLFRRKRRTILKSFFDRPRIYSTEHFHLHFEQRARENLRRAIS